MLMVIMIMMMNKDLSFQVHMKKIWKLRKDFNSWYYAQKTIVKEEEYSKNWYLQVSQ